MSGHLPHGMGVGREAFEVARLVAEIAVILREHQKNAVIDLPPEAFNDAMKRQARIDALKTQQRDHR